MNYINEKPFQKIFEYIIQNNKGDVNPYHNNKHMINVFNNSMLLFDMYRKEYGLKSKDRIELGTAALFHDFNHSGGKLKDDENIKLVIIELKKFLKENPDIDININNVVEILKSTEFPHKEIELNILQKIIRDADMCGVLVDNNFNLLISLSSELNKKIIDFIPIQIEFLKKLKYYSPYYNEVLDKNRERIIVGLIKLKNQLS